MQKPDIIGIATKEAVIISSCIALAFGIGRLGIFIPTIEKTFFSFKLAGLLYLASAAFRLGGLFIKWITYVPPDLSTEIKQEMPGCR